MEELDRISEPALGDFESGVWGSTLELVCIENIEYKEINNAQLMLLKRGMQLSSIAYCPFEIVQNWACRTQCYNAHTKHIKPVQVFHFPRIDTFGYIALDHSLETIIVVFRGTQISSINNLANNLKGSLVVPRLDDEQTNKQKTLDQIGIKIHKGFEESYKSAYPTIRETLKLLIERYPEYLIEFLGHSRGGAIALLTSWRVKLDSLTDDLQSVAHIETGTRASPRIKVVTYGAPAVGNEAFQRHFQKIFNDEYKHCMEIMNKGDPVPLSFGSGSSSLYVHTLNTVLIRSTLEFPECKVVQTSKSSGTSSNRLFVKMGSRGFMAHSNYFGVRECNHDEIISPLDQLVRAIVSEIIPSFHDFIVRRIEGDGNYGSSSHSL